MPVLSDGISYHGKRANMKELVFLIEKHFLNKFKRDRTFVFYRGHINNAEVYWRFA